MAVSVDGLEDTRKLEEALPNLTILSDAQLSLAKALAAVHARASPEGEDIAAPTTLIVNQYGTIYWTFRPDRHIERLAVAELIDALERHRTLWQPVGSPPIPPR